MERIGFIGSYDKKDLLLNIAKVLTSLNNRVLIIDATSMQRFRYIVPKVSQNNNYTYISEYQGIDVALGFMHIEEIENYIGKEKFEYDFVFIDSDNIQTITSFEFDSIKKIYFVTSYDIYEVQRAMEILKMIKEPSTIEITKVILSSDMSSSQDKYLNHLLSETNVKVQKDNIEFADTVEDKKANLENQLIKEIRIKPYTSTYKYSLEYITASIADGMIKQEEIRRIIRKI